MLACDWVGNSYSPSMMRTACLMPSSKLPFWRWNSRLTIGALRMCSNSLSWPGKFGFDSDQVTLSARAALTAFHSFSATTASRSLIQTTLAPGMCLIEASSTFTGTAPATVGRIMRACSMPGSRTSLTISSVPKTLPGRSLARQRLADDLEVGRLLQRRLDFDLQAIAQPAVPFHRLVEIAPADQLRIGHALGLCPRRAWTTPSVTVSCVGRNAELLARHLDQQPPRLGGGAPQHRAAMRHADGGAGAAHVEGERAVAHDHAHALIGDVDLFRDHLRDGGAEPLPAVDLAVIGDDRAVGLDGDVGRKLVALERRPRGVAIGAALRPNPPAPRA